MKNELYFHSFLIVNVFYQGRRQGVGLGGGGGKKPRDTFYFSTTNPPPPNCHNGVGVLSSWTWLTAELTRGGGGIENHSAAPVFYIISFCAIIM